MYTVQQCSRNLNPPCCPNTVYKRDRAAASRAEARKCRCSRSIKIRSYLARSQPCVLRDASADCQAESCVSLAFDRPRCRKQAHFRNAGIRLSANLYQMELRSAGLSQPPQIQLIATSGGNATLTNRCCISMRWAVWRWVRMQTNLNLLHILSRFCKASQKDQIGGTRHMETRQKTSKAA